MVIKWTTLPPDPGETHAPRSDQEMSEGGAASDGWEAFSDASSVGSANQEVESDPDLKPGWLTEGEAIPEDYKVAEGSDGRQRAVSL